MHPSSSANPILGVITAGLATAGVRTVPFPDVVADGGLVLLHWSEELWSAPPGRGPSGRRRAAERQRRRTALLEGLDAARRRGARVVWVRHNRIPATAAWDARLAGLVARLDAVVHLHEGSRAADVARPWGHLPAEVIPHPRYAPPLADPAAAASPLREVLMVGAIEGRKRHLPALAAARAAGLEATVVGKPADPRLVRRLRRLVRRSGGTVRLIDRYVTDAELDGLLAAARAVLLHQPGQLNSGAAWFALSRGAVVVGADSPALRAARDVVGPDWVRVLAEVGPGPLSEARRDPVPVGRPDLGALPTGAGFAARLLALAAALPSDGSGTPRR